MRYKYALPGGTSVFIIAIAALIGCAQPDQRAGGGPQVPTSYPDSQRIDHVDTYHGTEVVDPYRWLEELDSPVTAAWVESENAVADPFLEAIPTLEQIRERLTKVWNYERYKVPVKEGGRYFYRRNDGLQDQDVLYVVDSLEDEPRVLIDPNTFSDDRTASLSFFEVSPDGKLIAYGISDSGSDWRHWHVRNVETGEDLDDRLDQTKFTGVSWARDSSGFYYSRYPLDGEGDADDSQQVSVYFHKLGTPQADDVHVYSITDHETRNPYATVTDDGRYLVHGIFDGYESNGVYVKKLGDPEAEVVRILDEWDALYNLLGNDGSTFYFSTTNEAPKYRVIAIDVENPAPENWREVVAETEEAQEDASLIGEHIVAMYLRDASSLVKVFDLEGQLIREVELPGIGSASGFNGKLDDPETFYIFEGFTTPGQIYRYDVASGESSLFREAKVEVDLSPFVTKQVFYESNDGTRVPMFITHRQDLDLDGTNPTLLYGYGGFNVSLTPYYSPRRIVWMEMGGVLAIPNLRGGGEYGEEWHKAGTKLEKQNVFDDFIAAAEWLIDNGYTSPKKLAIRGGSNGGLLVGAVMTQRPDLFGATLPVVGVLDMLRYHTASANARQWSSDYGLSENEDEFQALHAYSPYHNTDEGTCYPPTLITTADHDDRVVPWHSFKFAAALQHAQSCDSPVLIRVETRAGHGAGKPTWMQIEDVANQWAFLVWALEMEG
ncbi:MAG: prolyl oligopeptidase family serine peptidase [Thermoanaerobaculia bacterium]